MKKTFTIIGAIVAGCAVVAGAAVLACRMMHKNGWVAYDDEAEALEPVAEG